jgi:hypothetical protein
MNTNESPSFEFQEIAKHELYESESGNIVISETTSDGPDQFIVLPLWRARQVASALEELLQHIHDRENRPF